VAQAVERFRIHVPDAQIDDLRRRLAATRWPDQIEGAGWDYGSELGYVRELCEHWRSKYDWRSAEALLNRFEHLRTTIDGQSIHFLHAPSRHANALPLLISHGWPGSVVEFLDVIEPLRDPEAHGGRAEDAFHVVLPSLPGYGFSGEPSVRGWNAPRVAGAWATLMQRLGYTRYVAQGGDVGAAVTDLMGRFAPPGLLGIHMNLLVTVLGIADQLPRESEQERAAHAALATFQTDGFGYFLEMATRPQTIGYALLDSPIALAAWMCDHDTDSYYKIARAFVDEEPTGNLTRDHILDNVTLYWLTGTAASAARSYWEDALARAQAAAAGQPPPDVKLPVGFTTFPGELWRAPRSWVEKSYPNVAYFNEVDKGGHFAAWEEPQLFAQEMRAAFRSLR
jgi:pimeloyl-ACP methyl ester carboxylesterase